MGNKGTIKRSYCGKTMSTVGNELVEKQTKYRKAPIKRHTKSNHKHNYLITKVETFAKDYTRIKKECTICDRNAPEETNDSLYLINGLWYDIGWNRVAEDGFYNFRCFDFDTQKYVWKNIKQETFDKYWEDMEERRKSFQQKWLKEGTFMESRKLF